MALHPLSTRAVIRIAGPDARKLLNDTLTCRFDEGLRGVGRWFALLSPQGRIQAEGLVTESGGAYWIDIAGEVAADFLRRMTLYRLRASVEIGREDGRTVLWSPDGASPDGDAIAYRDGRADTLGTRFIVAAPAPGTRAETAWLAARIAAGVCEMGADFGVNETFPHDIGMDLLGGVDFVKGCYVGQEVVSRMQHRGTARRRPVIVTGLPDGAAAGAPVMAGEREAGTLGAVADGRAVAILRLDRLSDPDAARVAGEPVALMLPEWGTYRFGESEPAD